MKKLEVPKDLFRLGPYLEKPSSIYKYLSLLLVLWLPLKPVLSNLVVPESFSGVVAPFLVLLVLVALALEKGIEVKFGLIEKIFAVFLGVTSISAVLGLAVYDLALPVVKDTAVIFEIFFLYLLGKNLTKEDFLFIAKYGLIEAALIGLYGIWQFAAKVPINPLWVVPGETLRARVFGTFESPNALSSYLLVWFWISIIFGLKKQKEWFLSTVIILLAIYFTYSRSILLALVAGVMTVLILNRKKLNIRILIAPTLVLSSGIIFFTKRISALFTPTYFFYTNEAGRNWAIKNVFHIVRNHPFFGVGPGLYGGQTATSYSSPVYLESIQHGFVATYITDNQYLQILIQQGILGLVCYFWLMVEMTKKLLMYAKKEIVTGGAILAIWVGYSFSGLFENTWFIQATATVVWIIMGVAVRESE